MINNNEKLEIPEEFKDVNLVLVMGAKKYGANSWLHGNHFDTHKNHKSMTHHLLESYRDMTHKDLESGLDPLLHLACRALMEYTLRKRGLMGPSGHVQQYYQDGSGIKDKEFYPGSSRHDGNAK